MKTIFLSASVPLPDRNPRFFESTDVVAIKDCVKALVTVFVPHGRIVFGGHPAITPLVRELIRGMEISVREHVVLFQSRFFAHEFPPEVAEYERVVIVPAVNNDRDSSLARMRNEMLSFANFHSAVFIGGMEGIIDEHDLFLNKYPNRPLYPIASTGGAARELFNRRAQPIPDLNDELTYLTLFRRLLLD